MAMNIQEVETRTRLTRANIRFYEKEGLVTPERQENGYRNYSQDDVEALLRIKLLRELGFSLQAVGQIQRGELDFQEMLSQRIRETEQEERRLQSIRAVCTSMQEEGVQYATLNAQTYLNQYYRGLSSPPRQSYVLEADVVPPDPHPWRRWMARGLDGMLVSALFAFVWCIPLHHFLTGINDLASTVVGVPAQVVKINGQPVQHQGGYVDEVDQVHITDPVEDEIEMLTQRIHELETDLANCRRRHPDHVHTQENETKE